MEWDLRVPYRLRNIRQARFAREIDARGHFFNLGRRV